MGTTTLRRRNFVRAVLESTRRTGDAVAPWQHLGGLGAEFEDETDLLVELHREWIRLLVGRLHRGGIVAARTPGNVRDLYDELSSAHPSLRRILDAHRADPGLQLPTAREHALLARVSGLASDATAGDQASPLGQALVSQRIPTQRPRGPAGSPSA